MNATPFAVLLGAGRPKRGTSPSALQATPQNRRALDWLLSAFRSRAEVHYVGGYQLDEVARAYPELSYSVNASWRTTGSVGSLLVAPLRPDRTHYLSYSDVIYSPTVIDALGGVEADVVAAVDAGWRTRYAGRPATDLRTAEILQLTDGLVMGAGSGHGAIGEDAEFAGLVKLSGRAVETVLELKRTRADELAAAQLPALLDVLRDSGFAIHAVDVGADWAELNAPQDLSRFVLGTKAHTLARLAPMVRRSRVGDQVRFTVREWREGPDRVLHAIRSEFPQTRLAVRSSALSEDSWQTANAGVFESLLNVESSDPAIVTQAIDRVIGSYGDESLDNEVLVQEMITDIRVSGVAFTRTLSHGAPYYQINYDDQTTSTESVTSGTGEGLKMMFVHRSSPGLPPSSPPVMSGLLDALRELESLVGHDSLDVEFGIDASGLVHVLQSRPIVVDHSEWFVDDADVDAALEGAVQMFVARQTSSPFACGDVAMFGVMPDWNPAEIIGVKPRRLALSLYRYLITDDVWATQRAEHLYRDVRPLPLLACLAGHPFVDIRASLSSFVPAAVPDDLARRLVDYYLARLRDNPHLHDKIEFEVAVTCLSFNFDEQAETLLAAGFSAEDVTALRSGLCDVTRHAFERYAGDLATIERLSARYDRIAAAGMEPLQRAIVLLEDCKRYGTLPFAHLARGAFVATTLLRSMVERSVISEDEASRFLMSLETVAKRFTLDAQAVAQERLGWDAFVERYGHLRPGTYEITSPSYASDPGVYLRPAVEAAAGPAEHATFEWPEASRERITQGLEALGLPGDLAGFERFLRSAMEGREYAKFVFSRNLSKALDALSEFGQAIGLSEEELSHLPITDLRAASVGQNPARMVPWLRQRYEEGLESYRLVQSVELPPLVSSVEDLFAFSYEDSQPNFVSRARVTAEVAHLEDGATYDGSLAGKIVMIPQADPGWDWLFGHGIGGLVTRYGGANSHMAIRAAELNLPAAIGVGDGLYLQLSRVKLMELDCLNRHIRPIG